MVLCCLMEDGSNLPLKKLFKKLYECMCSACHSKSNNYQEKILQDKSIFFPILNEINTVDVKKWR